MYRPVFRFLSYVSPVWYFNLKPDHDHGYFPIKTQIDKFPNNLSEDQAYRSQEARELDLAWNAFQAGYISNATESGKNVWNSGHVPLEDEYRFLRKNFHPLWSIYVLCLRLLMLNTPFRESRAYWHARKAKRVNHAKDPIEYPGYATFISALVESKPRVSIIIPTLNRYPWLHDGLKDLENQSYKNFEVIVVDQSQPYSDEFYKGWNLSLRVWHQEEKALWKARNEAIQAAEGDYILLYDDDSRVESDWIVQHLKTLDFFKADISSGVSISKVGAKVPAHYAYFRWSDQLDTGNVLIKRDVFKRIGLFDLQFEKQRMGDGEFGLRAYLAGFRNISNPKAIRLHLKADEGGLRQMGSWDGWRPKSLFSPRPVPSILYLYRKYFGNEVTRRMIINLIIPSLVPYRLKNSKLLFLVIPLFVPFVFPFLIIQVGRSWHLAGIKLKQGSVITTLN